MAQNIVTKYKLNTEDFKIFFDNDKKTHVAQNIETGEKTNIGVLGIFLEMGILHPLDEADKLSVLIQRINDIESKLNKIIETLDKIQLQQAVQLEKTMKTTKITEEIGDNEEKKIEDETEEELEDIEKKPKFDIKKKIMEKPLKKIKERITEENKPIEESEEEIDAWEDI